MLFNSFEFILLFLPITLAVFFGLGSLKYYRLAIVWLVCASLFFYGYWNPAYLYLMIGSILFNYGTGRVLQRLSRDSKPDADAGDGAIALENIALEDIALEENRPANIQRLEGLNDSVKEGDEKKPGFSRGSLFFLVGGIAVNLVILGYYKYANFFVDNLNAIADFDLQLKTIVLPLAISFFTFQQIAYLVDVYQKKIVNSDFLDYCLFVTFFPQLIAGPIVHHQEMMPQFKQPAIFSPNINAMTVGVTLFVMGLCKKVAIADTLAQYANPVFDAALKSQSLSFGDAWMGSLAYTFQLYFDFSGYADMSIGIAQLFGLTLPLNFFSPYKSVSIIEFWRRWHMTLSRFLRDYLYIPLGGNRQGNLRRYVNLMITMVIGGLWHGAGWTFIFWGFLHGFYLAANHLWRTFLKHTHRLKPAAQLSPWKTIGAIALTFFSIHISWVFFRAESFDAALSMLATMFGLGGLDWSLTARLIPVLNDPYSMSPFVMLGVAAALVFLSPNTYEIMRHEQPAFETYKVSSSIHSGRLQWHPTSRWAIATSLLIGVTILHLFQTSEFLYFDF
ncbi:MAG: MBOAT family protein [Elainellaceae cyanobacterium]